MESVARLSPAERRELFAETAALYEVEANV
jgi:hypothetical protein